MVVYIDALNPDSDGYCRTLKAQYYKNNIKNLAEWGNLWMFGCYSYAIRYKYYM